MKFSKMTHIGPWHRINRKNLEFLKIQDGDGRHLEKKSQKIAMSTQRFDRSLRDLVC